MEQSRRIRRLDDFRWIAAALVVAIHTSPLESLNETADFLLTRVLARVAVPFFFMVTGYFVLAEEKSRRENIIKTLKRTGKLYLVLTLLYLPVQCYKVLPVIQAGAVSAGKLAAAAVRAVLFDGTYYHLWYFPALMLGLCLAGVLLRDGGRRALIRAGGLYVLGMLGDSYYGLTERIPLLKRFFDELFHVSSYTRNGLFYAPLFLIMGALMADACGRSHRRHCGTGLLCGSLLLMIAEGLLLHHFQLQRHDSMYGMLPFVMAGLFGMLLAGDRQEAADGYFSRKAPMLVYFLHPLVILGLRGVAKLTHCRFLLTVSPLYYLLVLGGSVAAAGSCLWIARWYQKRKKNGDR